MKIKTLEEKGRQAVEEIARSGTTLKKLCKVDGRELNESGTEPAADAYVEAADDVVLFLGEAPVLDIGPEIIQPPKPAALPAPL